MLYTLDLGPTEETIARQAYMSGEPMPDRIRDAPRLLAGLQLYFQAFFDLDAERNHGFGFQAIPRSAMMQYARDYDLDDEQTTDLIYHVKEMDSAHIKRLESKRPTA